MHRLWSLAAVAVFLGCVWAPVAVAAPTGGYAVFAQCPTHAADVNGCLYAPVEGGYITLDKTVVPIAKTMVLQAGLFREREPSVKYLAGALDGETLTKVGQSLPGGLFGSPLTAVTELAAPASSISLNTGLGGDLLITFAARGAAGEPFTGDQMLDRIQRAPNRVESDDPHERGGDRQPWKAKDH